MRAVTINCESTWPGLTLSGKKYVLNKMHALNKQAFRYRGNGTFSSKSISLLVYTYTYVLPENLYSSSLQALLKTLRFPFTVISYKNMVSVDADM